MPVVLQPVAGRCHPETENLIRELDRRGWRVVRAFGSLGVDRVRSHLASQFLRMDLPREEWAFWCDSDMTAHPDAVQMLLDSAKEHNAAMMAAPSIQRKTFEINIRQVDHLPLELGRTGGVIEVTKAAFAFTVTHRRLFEAVAPTLPEVDYNDDGTGETFPGWPFFMPLIRNRTQYGEDYSMVLRARDAGLRIYADTRVVNYHFSEEMLGWDRIKGARVEQIKAGEAE